MDEERNDGKKTVCKKRGDIAIRLVTRVHGIPQRVERGGSPRLCSRVSMLVRVNGQAQRASLFFLVFSLSMHYFLISNRVMYIVVDPYIL